MKIDLTELDIKIIKHALLLLEIQSEIEGGNFAEVKKLHINIDEQINKKL